MNKYFNVFLQSGILFGLTLGAFFTIQNQSLTSGIVGGLFTGGLFGLAMATLTYTADRKSRATGIPTGNASTQQVLLFEVDQSIDELFLFCKESLHSFERCKLTYASQEDGIIHGTIGISWKSFGELIFISLRSI